MLHLMLILSCHSVVRLFEINQIMRSVVSSYRLHNIVYILKNKILINQIEHIHNTHVANQILI